MSRDYKVYLEDILEAVKNIEKYTKGLTRTEFFQDGKTIDAVIRNLEIIGEAVKALPEKVRKEHPHFEWKKIAGLRDILIHAYFEVDLEIIWDVIANKLPKLKKDINKMLEN